MERPVSGRGLVHHHTERRSELVRAKGDDYTVFCALDSSLLGVVVSLLMTLRVLAVSPPNFLEPYGR
jgi:hypothetical protein